MLLHININYTNIYYLIMKLFVKQSKKNIVTNYIIPILILVVIIAIIINQSKYSQTALNGLDIWVKVLVPSLFPFFVLTKLFSYGDFIQDFTHLFSKPFKKLYKCPPISSYIFLMSIITGYPVGAKLISDFYNTKQLNKIDAIKTLSFSANSGPMFILGSVAIGMFMSRKMGIIIYASHVLGSLINGIIYRNYGNKQKTIETQNNNQTCTSSITTHQNIFHDAKNDLDFSQSITSSISSIMLIGGVICFTFVIIEVITSSYFFTSFINLISNNGINSDFVCAIFSGILEITKGCLMLSSVPISFNLVCILCTAIISFGGISTVLQAVAFTKNIIPTKLLIFQKFTHAICSSIVCSLILLII